MIIDMTAGYDFTIRPDQLHPIVTEPIVQSIMRLIAHGTLLVVALQQFFELLKTLDLVAVASRLINVYTNP